MLKYTKSIQLKNNKSNNINNLLIYDKKINIEENYYTKLITSNINYYKDILCKLDNWDLLKRNVNDYEFLNLKNQNIAYYKPLSRSFYKLWEIIYDYNIINLYKLNNSHKLDIFCMAEAPGGFVDALSKILYNQKYNNYSIDTISLIDKNTNIPNWFYIYSKIKNNPNINIIDQIDGDLYKLDTIKYCMKNNKKYDIITADGGFDFSNNFNNQELIFSRLFYCEIITAISLQKINGTFICKCFELNTLLTQQIIFILYNLYDNIIFTKPSISRNTNSEKYIIAKGFQGIDEINLNKLYDILENWNNKLYINIPQKYSDTISKINHHYLKKQYECYKILHQLYTNNDNNYIKYIIKTQITKCISFCKKYYLSINYNSDFLNLSTIQIYKKYYTI